MGKVYPGPGSPWQPEPLASWNASPTQSTFFSRVTSSQPWVGQPCFSWPRVTPAQSGSGAVITSLESPTVYERPNPHLSLLSEAKTKGEGSQSLSSGV